MIKNGDIHRWEWWDAPKIKIKCGAGPDEGMMETLVIACACILTIFAVFWLQMRLIAGILNQKVAELDQNLANAIQMTIEKLPIGDIEPPNPFQVMLLQLMQDKMANNPAKVIARDDQGLFTAESKPESEK